MNNERRKQISKAVDLMTEAAQILTACAEEEQKYFDNMPESFQSGEKGTAAEDAVMNLESASDTVQNSVDEIEGLAL